MQHSARGFLFALIVVPCLSASAIAEDKFPWQMTTNKYARLTPEQRQIYLDAYFESMFFILYGITDGSNPEALKEINGWIDCILRTRKEKAWSPDRSWSVAEDTDKAAAWVLYHKVSPLMCHGFDKNAGANRRLLRIYKLEDWEGWVRKTKAIYLAGYLDTMATFETRLKERGMQSGLRELKLVIEGIGIEGILSVTMSIKPKGESPLPLIMAEGLRAARSKMIRQQG